MSLQLCSLFFLICQLTTATGIFSKIYWCQVLGGDNGCRKDVEDLFQHATSLYEFFKIHDVKKKYSGSHTLKRLIETRWSGHHASIKVSE